MKPHERCRACGHSIHSHCGAYGSCQERDCRCGRWCDPLPRHERAAADLFTGEAPCACGERQVEPGLVISSYGYSHSAEKCQRGDIVRMRGAATCHVCGDAWQPCECGELIAQAARRGIEPEQLDAFRASQTKLDL